MQGSEHWLVFSIEGRQLPSESRLIAGRTGMGRGALQRPGPGKGLYPAAQREREAQADRMVGVKLGMSCG